MKNTLKRLLSACTAAIAIVLPLHASQSPTYKQAYALTMSLYAPRIYNNNESLGQREYQKQLVHGTLFFEYDASGQLADITFYDMVNTTHKLSDGKHVTYNGFLDTSKTTVVAAIGSNKQKKFDVASICFSLKAEPSYNIGPFDEDTSLYITLSGKGKIKNGKIQSVSGMAVGSIGCGCYYYGHVSPTRLIWWYGVSDIVTDIAAVHGTWKMSRLK